MSKFLKRPKWAIALLLSVMGMIVYLMCSNELFGLLIQTDTSFRAISRGQFHDLKSSAAQSGAYVVTDWANMPAVHEDFYQSLSLNLVVFCETEEDNSNKHYELILESDQAIYRSTLSPHNGKSAMQNKIAAGYNLLTDNILLVAKLPTITLKNGVYRLYIYDYENDSTIGMCNTGMVFIKTSNSFYQFKGEAVPELPDAAFAGIEISLDVIEIDEDSLYISGWTNTPEINPEDQTVYVELYTDPFAEPEVIYHAAGIRRSGLGDYFNDLRYDYSGFNLTVPAPEFIRSELFYIRVVLADERQVRRSHLRIAYRLEDGNFVLLQWRSTHEDAWGDTSTLASPDQPMQTVEEHFSEELPDFNYNLTAKTLQDDEPDIQRYGIESISAQGNRLMVDGWVIGGEDGPNTRVFMTVDCSDRTRRTYLADLVERPDLVEKFGDEKYRYAGFSFALPASYIQQQTECHLFAEQAGQSHVARFCLLYADQIGWTLAPSPSAFQGDVPLSAETSISLDAIQAQDGYISLYGWIYDPLLDVTKQNVYVEMTAGAANASEAYLCIPLRRPGLGEALKLSADYDHAGYTVSLPLPEDYDAGTAYLLSFILDDGDSQLRSDTALQIEDGQAAGVIHLSENGALLQ